MKKLAKRTLANTLIARVLRVAFTNQEWEVWRLANDEKMNFPDIGRQLGVDPDDAHATYMRIKQYMADQAAATDRAKATRPEYDRARGDAPQEKTLDLSQAKDVKRVEYMKLIAIKQIAEGILTSLREKRNDDPAAAMKAMETELTELISRSGASIQQAKSEAEKEQKENKAASFDPRRAARLLDLARRVGLVNR